jgi:two-component system, cell cycle sensor histidine kinase and response regulator CckA
MTIKPWLDSEHANCLEELVQRRTAELLSINQRLQQEIEARKQTETALQASEERYRSVVMGLREGVMLQDAQGQILTCNQSAETILGLTEAQMMGHSSLDPPWQTIHEDGSAFPGSAHPSMVTLRTGRPCVDVIMGVHKPDGSLCWLTVNSQPLIMPGETRPYAVVASFVDITERKQMEAQLLRVQRLESIGTLASGIAHDLNNVLTPILASSQLLLLKHPDLDVQSQRLLKMLESSARRGAALVKQILTFAKGAESRPTALDLRSIVTDAVLFCQQTFSRTIMISVEMPEDHMPMVLGDATQLHQVLMNLCLNARDAMLEGGNLSITVKAQLIDNLSPESYRSHAQKQYVVLTVKDSGTGIPHETIDRIFDPFFTTKAVDKGTGLGLSTASRIIQNHGGFITIDSQLDQGSEFRVFLPAVLAEV